MGNTLLSVLLFSYTFEIVVSSFNTFWNLSDFSHIDLYFVLDVLGSVEPGNYMLHPQPFNSLIDFQVNQVSFI